MESETTTFDFEVTGDQSICIITPISDGAKEWCDDNLEDDAMMMGNGYAVEMRYIRDICYGILNDGMTITKDGKAMIVKEEDEELILV